ncbi:MAG: hypothetical protein ACK438_03130 [Flavobacteriales bacterium]
MKSVKLSFTIIVTLCLSSCAKVFYSPDAIEVSQSHKIVAVIPPSVSIAASKKIDGESLKEQQRTESLNFQKEIYAWMLQRKMQGKMVQEILDVETTNAKLLTAGYPEKPLSPSEICSVLGVDGIIGSNFGLSKPMSDGAAIAVALLGGATSTNEIRVSLNINDCLGKKLIWNYDHKYSGGIGSSPSRMVNDIMRSASMKMPYLIK